MKINVKKVFKHCVKGELHPTTFNLGEQEVDEETGEIAVREGWAVPLDRQSSGPSFEKSSASHQEDPSDETSFQPRKRGRPKKKA